MLEQPSNSQRFALCLEHIKKSFGGVPALHDMSLGIEHGNIVSLLGPSGCGKTTSLRIIAGFERQDVGTLYLVGKEVSSRRVYERNIGLVFQDYALFPHMTVGENVAYGLKQKRWENKAISRRVGEMLELVRLGDRVKYKPGQLSGGQQQRVALARALAPKPDLILLDEPLSALDTKLREELRSDLKAILKSLNTTTIIVTHDQSEAMGLSDRIVVMSRGHIVQEGTPNEIYECPRTRFVAEFMGRANFFIPTSWSRSSAGIVNAEVDKGLTLALPAGAANQLENAEICVRAERIRLVPRARIEQPSGQQQDSRIEVVVDEVVPLGRETEIHVRTNNGNRICIIEHARREHPWKAGDTAAAMVSRDDCLIVKSDPENPKKMQIDLD